MVYSLNYNCKSQSMALCVNTAQYHYQPLCHDSDYGMTTWLVGWADRLFSAHSSTGEMFVYGSLIVWAYWWQTGVFYLVITDAPVMFNLCKLIISVSLKNVSVFLFLPPLLSVDNLKIHGVARILICIFQLVGIFHWNIRRFFPSHKNDTINRVVKTINNILYTD